MSSILFPKFPVFILLSINVVWASFGRSQVRPLGRVPFRTLPYPGFGPFHSGVDRRDNLSSLLPSSSPKPNLKADEDSAASPAPILECLTSENREFKFLLSSRRNGSGHWLADMEVQPGAWASATGESPFEVHLEHRTRTCVTCDAAEAPLTRVSLREPPPTRLPTAGGYRHFPGFGYYRRHLDHLSWREARAVCQEEGADLVVINSEAEAKLLLELSAPLLFLRPAEAWNAEAYVGISDFHHEGIFYSVDGIPLNETGYEHWSPGEPNNHREEDCVTIVRNAMYNDVGCSKTFEFICEVPE